MGAFSYFFCSLVKVVNGLMDLAQICVLYSCDIVSSKLLSVVLSYVNFKFTSTLVSLGFEDRYILLVFASFRPMRCLSSTPQHVYFKSDIMQGCNVPGSAPVSKKIVYSKTEAAE